MASRRSFGFAVVSALSNGLSFSARASEPDSRDGFMWLDMNSSTKIGYVMGFCAGANVASGLWDSVNDEGPVKLSAKQKRLASRASDYTGLKFGQLVDGLDEFYRDFRNKQIQVEDAMAYVRNEIQGDTQDLLEKELTVLRKSATSAK